MELRAKVGISIAVALAANSATANPALDGAFYPGWGDGGSGIVVSNEFVSEPFDYWNSIQDIVALPDGSSILIGTVGVSDDIGLLRLTPKGQPDPAFGTGGFAIVPDDLWLSAFDATLDKDGMLLLGGSRFEGPVGNEDFAVCRVNPATGATITFAGTGSACVTVEFPEEKVGDLRQSQASTVIARSDGSIVLTGSVAHAASLFDDRDWLGAMAKLKPDGTLDAAFGSGGKRTFLVPQTLGTFFNKCGSATNGKFICNAQVIKSKEPVDIDSRFLRFDANGVFEASWPGGADVAVPGFANNYFMEFALIDVPNSSEDDIIVMGNAFNEQLPESQPFVTRISGSTGQKNNQFGVDGFVFIQYAKWDGFVVQPGTGFILADLKYQTITAQRFRFDGSVDASFGNAGTQEISAGIGVEGSDISFDAMRAAGDGLYLLGNSYTTHPGYNFGSVIAAKLTLDGIFADGYED